MLRWPPLSLSAIGPMLQLRAPPFARLRSLVNVATAVGLAIFVGVAGGLALTAAALRTDAIGTSQAGPWRIFTDAGTAAINPYLRARMARTGEIPLSAAEGVTAIARSDDQGSALDGRCGYSVSGAVPASLFWTIEAAGTDGQPFRNAAGRQEFSSRDIVRDAAGRFTIALAPSVQPGNWLPSPGAGHVMLILRLYDVTASRAGRGNGTAFAVPSIAKVGSCA